jgi:hypothetical protein
LFGCEGGGGYLEVLGVVQANFNGLCERLKGLTAQFEAVNDEFHAASMVVAGSPLK